MGYHRLEEIEAALNSLEYINQSAVIYDRVNKIWKNYAYVASKKKITEHQIKNEIRNLYKIYDA